MQNERSRPKRRRLSKAEKLERFQSGPFAQIHDKASLVDYLINHPNVYNEKVLTYLYRQNLSQAENASYDEKHHIIVNTAGGPVEAWNLIPVTYAEHKELHQLRYEVYGEKGDRIAALSRDEIHVYLKEQKAEASRRGHATQREKELGFFNSKIQVDLGRRSASLGKTPNRVAAYAKQAQTFNKYVFLFEKSLKFQFHDKKGNIASAQSTAFQFQRTGEIHAFLVKHTPKTSDFYKKIESDKSFTTNFNKVLRRLLPDVTGQDVRNTYKG